MQFASLSEKELENRLILSAINYEENREKLEGFPYIKKGSYAVLAQLCIGEKNEKGQYTACLTVTEHMLEGWKLSKEKLFEVAVMNSKRLFPVECLSIDKFMDYSYQDTAIMLPENVEISDIIVLSNKEHFNGVATIFYEPEVLDEISQKINSEKIMLFPSSINEIYCMPLRGKEHEQEYMEIVANWLEVLQADALTSKSAMIYDSKSKEINEIEGESFNLDISPISISKQGLGR